MQFFSSPVKIKITQLDDRKVRCPVEIQSIWVEFLRGEKTRMRVDMRMRVGIGKRRMKGREGEGGLEGG